jgi:competence protein ComEA
MKQFFKDYLTFSKKERIAVFLLLLCIVFIVVLPQFFSVKKSSSKPNEELVALMKKINDKQPDSSELAEENKNTFSKKYLDSPNLHFELFMFDPNSLNADGWKKLGLRDKTIQTIMHYRDKGGRFKKPEDIAKIWGLHKEEAERLIPYINIQNDEGNEKLKYQNTSIKKPNLNIDVNLATAQDFAQLPGMDRSLCYRIIHFREKLGGFISVLQVKETYGLHDSLFTSIYPYLHFQSNTTHKLNINTAGETELNNHPYIKKDVARAIVLYRTQHGAYNQVQDIKKVVIVTEETFSKISPYLTTE